MSAATTTAPHHHHHHHHPRHLQNPFVRPASASRKTMSVTQTYLLTHKARAKLSREAAQPDHDLRLLVGHANLLDSLMLELADAEREQERWFNQSVRGATKAPARHVQWADRVEEQAIAAAEDDSSDDESDLDVDDDFAEGDFEMAHAAAASPPALLHDDDLEDDYAHLELVRTPSHSSSSPPELVDPDSAEESSDDSMPPLPAYAAAMPYGGHDKQANKGVDSTDDALDEHDYYLTRRNAAGLVSAISVY